MDVKLHNKLFRLISFSILFFLTSQVWAQVSTLDVIGVVEQDMVAVENAKITLSKDGKVIQTEYTNRKGEFRFQMDINSEYLVEISKQGLLTKKIAFNTEIPSDVVGKWTMEFAMSLFPGCEGANTSALDSPVDRVKYSSNQGDFISDEAYVRNMRGRIEKMMIDIENCQVETYQEAMEEANKLLQQGDYEAARQKYKEALEVYPDDRTAQRKLADIYKKIGEEKQDEQIFREAVAEADRLYDQKEYAAAKQLYTEALQRKPDPHAQSRLNEIDRLISTQQQASQAAAETERNYTNLIAQANAAYARKDYDAAKQFYQQAMTVKPDASLPRQKVDEISSLIAQQQQQNQQQEALDKSFNEAMAMGQSALQAKDYEAAKRHFNRAQMMKPNEALPRQKIGEIDKAVVDEKRANEMAQQAAQQQRLDQALAEADRMMAQEDYDGALTAYQNALQLNPNDPYLKQQMKKAESAKQGAALEKQNALEKAYQNDISKGDELMASGAYDQAMEAYKQAMMKKPNDAQANSKIQAAQSRQLAAQQQQTLEKNKQRQYEQYLADGNRLFDAKQYPQSKQAYEQALSLYPTQPAPRNRISEIDRILTAQQQEEQYRQTVVKADGLFATKDYTAARTAYQEAQSLKANDPYPVQKINEIDRIIRENSRLQEEQRQLEAQYQQTIQDADRLLAQSRLPESKNAYQKALSYKPGETYPRQQITKIENQLTEQQRLVDQKKAEEEKYASLITDANRLFDAKDYGQAKAAYQQALAMKSAEA
ncbi:MAG: tetratricopeptide repeat protein, partial [Bacteroidales bacterium]|nr:tetratricopeptide repeat protein [Bacteroidales bacterium]